MDAKTRLPLGIKLVYQNQKSTQNETDISGYIT